MSTNISTNRSVALQRRQSVVHSVEFRIIAFFLLHIPLAFLLDLSDWVGTFHAVITLLYGLHVAARQDHERVIAVLGYIAGAEILWRMASANIFWEYGKYASVVLILFTALATRRQYHVRDSKSSRFNPAILFYFAFLLPSLVLTLSELNMARARTAVSFNLSGPLAITILVIYFWQRQIPKKGLMQLLFALVAPIVGILTRSLWSTITASSLEFTLNANFVTSGGFGPNQVSNLLGLGALACLIILVHLWQTPSLRLFFAGLGALFTFQAFLTFSRGGVYSFVLAAVAFSFHLLTSSKARNRFAFLVGAAAIVAWYIGIPFLDQITSSIWQDRFTSLDTTGRRELALADLEIFLEHPITGVGVGLSKQNRDLELNAAANAHTEYSRTLAEHGILGAVSFLILLSITIASYRRTSPGMDRALVATFAIWSFSIMVHSGMRFVAISLLLALAVATWQVNLDDPAWEEVA